MFLRLNIFSALEGIHEDHHVGELGKPNQTAQVAQSGLGVRSSYINLECHYAALCMKNICI